MISFNMIMDTLFTKTSFFHNFQKKLCDFFTIFKRNDAIFSQLVWYWTPSQFWEKNAVVCIHCAIQWSCDLGICLHLPISGMSIAQLLISNLVVTFIVL